MLAPPWPESVRKPQEVHFVNRVQYLDGGALDDLVFQHGYSKRSFPPVRLLDIGTPNWSCPVGAARQPPGKILQVFLQVLSVMLPRLSVNPCGSLMLQGIVRSPQSTHVIDVVQQRCET